MVEIFCAGDRGSGLFRMGEWVLQRTQGHMPARRSSQYLQNPEILFTAKGKVHPRTDHEGPKLGRGIAVLSL